MANLEQEQQAMRERIQQHKRSDKPLTQRERLFVKYVHDGLPKEAAAIKAGYPEASARSRASELQQDPRVQLLLAKLNERVDIDPKELTEEYVITRLLRLTELAMRKGKDSSAIRCLELLGKQIGMFVERRTAEERYIEGLADTIAEVRARLAESQRREHLRTLAIAGEVRRDDRPASPESDPEKVN